MTKVSIAVEFSAIKLGRTPDIIIELLLLNFLNILHLSHIQLTRYLIDRPQYGYKIINNGSCFSSESCTVIKYCGNRGNGKLTVEAYLFVEWITIAQQ